VSSILKGGRHVILVVDDNRQARATIVSGLAMLGLKTVEAADGPTAIEFVKTEHFDAVILDLIMPGMDGIQVATAIGQIDPTIPLIFVTGYGDEQSIHRAMGWKVPVLHKPFQVRELAALLNLMLITPE